MNSKNKSAKPHNTIKSTQTRYEWRKSVRRAARLRKKEAKRAAEVKQESSPKRYDMLAQYHSTLKDKVREIIEKNHIKYAIMTDAYFVITNLSAGSCKEIEDAFSKCEHFRGHNKKPWTVKFSKWKSKTIIDDKKEKVKKPTNNTVEARKEAKIRRKARNIQKYKARKKHSLGRKAKIAAFRAKKNHGNKVTPGTKETLLQKKLKKRAQKAANYLTKQENKKQQPLRTKNSYKAKKKSAQTEVNFAA